MNMHEQGFSDLETNSDPDQVAVLLAPYADVAQRNQLETYAEREQVWNDTAIVLAQNPIAIQDYRTANGNIEVTWAFNRLVDMDTDPMWVNTSVTGRVPTHNGNNPDIALGAKVLDQVSGKDFGSLDKHQIAEVLDAFSDAPHDKLGMIPRTSLAYAIAETIPSRITTISARAEIRSALDDSYRGGDAIEKLTSASFNTSKILAGMDMADAEKILHDYQRSTGQAIGTDLGETDTSRLQWFMNLRTNFGEGAAKRQFTALAEINGLMLESTPATRGSVLPARDAVVRGQRYMDANTNLYRIEVVRN